MEDHDFMVLKDTVKKMDAMLKQIVSDLTKAFEKGNKAASQRVRTHTIKFAKLSKQYRKESVAAEKGAKKRKKVVRKKVASKKVAAKKKRCKRRSC